MEHIAAMAEFSEAVRGSTLSRLQKVPEYYENWRPSPGAMSVGDILQHLLDCDKWLIEKILLPETQAIQGQAGQVVIEDRRMFVEKIEELRVSGTSRKKWITGLDNSILTKEIFDDRFGKNVTIWWIIMRGNIDHEIHHRGQLSVYLRMIYTELSTSHKEFETTTDIYDTKQVQKNS